jgi:ligand-binding sensor domain-containing protein
MQKCLLIFLLTYASFTALSQQFPITRLGVEEGLGHSIAYRTFQSSDGYLWFSTDNGLTRFDGENFKNFTAPDGLKANFIFDVQERDSTLIISSFGGGLMTYKNNQFKPYHADTTTLRFPITIQFFRNELWCIDRYKLLHRVTKQKPSLITANEMSVLDDDFVETYSISVADTVMYIGTSSGLFSFDGKQYVRFRNPEFSKTNIYNAKVLRNGNLLVCTQTRLFEFNLRTGTLTSIFESRHFSPSTYILEDHEGNIWLSLINGDTYLFKPPVQNAAREIIKVLEGVVVNQLYEDRERNIWVSTYGEGAWCIHSIHVRNYPIRGSILTDVIVESKNKELVVATTNGGLKMFTQTKSGFLTNVTEDPRVALFKRKRNIVAAIEVSPGFSCFSSDEMFFKWKENRLDSLKAPALISVFYHERKKSRIWIGCRFGLAFYEEATGLNVVNGFKDRVIKSISEDKEGTILLGTDNGIYKETSKGFSAIPGSKNMFSYSYINALYTDGKTGITWVGTNSGLGKIENGSLQFVDYPLAKIRCNSIIGDNDGRIWIGTVNGLLHYNQKKYDIITTKEGIAQSNVNKVIYQPAGDLITILTSNGISVIDAHNFLEDAQFELPDIIIEKISSGSKSLPFTTSVFELDEGQRDLKVFISTPMVKNRHKITYSYQLNDDPWTEFSGRELSLKELPHGDLKLTIRVHEQYRSSVEKSKSVALLVPRPFFLRWWFMLIILTILLGVIAAIVFSYSRQKNKKLLEENKRLDIEHKALRNLLNPHFLYNAINSIHAFILQNDQRKTLAYLSKFSQLVRLNLELLSSDRVSLEKEIKNISLYLEFEKLRFAEKLKYHIEIDSSIAQPEIEIPPFLIQPFLENAIWHGLLPREQGGTLLLRVNRSDDKLVISIDDDGVGINTSLKFPKADLEKKTSMGINIIRERIELLKKFSGDYGLLIIDKSELNGKASGTGTVVKITVPFVSV